MSTFSLNSSHVGSLPQPNQHQIWSRKPSDQLSRRSNQSTSTVQRPTGRKVSAASVGSLGSKSAGLLRVVNENIPPSSRSTSYASLTAFDKTENISSSRINSPTLQARAVRDSAAFVPAGLPKPASSLFVIDGTFRDVDLNRQEHQFDGERAILEKRAAQVENGIHRTSEQKTISSVAAQSPSRGSSANTDIRREINRLESRTSSSNKSSEHGVNPFKKLVGGIRPQRSRNKGQLIARRERWSLDDFEDTQPAKGKYLRPPNNLTHRKASSWSSGSFLTPGKLGPQDGMGLGHNSEKSSRLRFLMRSSRSSKISDTTQRASVDAGIDIPRMIDEMAHHRAIQRRKILEELHSSEEGYINDLKVLAHVYLTILSSSPHFPRDLQNEVVRNLNDMLLLHEEILIQFKLFLRDPPPKRGHHRWGSSDSVLKGAELTRKESRKARHSLESMWSRHSQNANSTATPNEAADIMKIFGGMMPRFFIYEEYGARYEAILQLVAATSKSIPSWEAFERGIEALMNSLLPKKVVEQGKKKGLTLEDLLIKPIQRVCRYPLLFAELLKNTPTIDDETSEATIQRILNHFKMAAREINDATNDPQTRSRIHRSWQLHYILSCPRQVTFTGCSTHELANAQQLDTPDVLRTLGHVKLCGLLYGVYQSEGEKVVRGQYMLCALFGAHLLLAIPEAKSGKFLVQAIVHASHIRLESSNDDQGLQYNGAHCWKLVLTMYQQLQELVLCACSELEESQWKTEILRASGKFEETPATPGVVFLDLKIRSFRSTSSKANAPSRRASAENHSRSPLRTKSVPVVIKDAATTKENLDSPRSLSSPLKRSKSVQSPGYGPIFILHKGERARLETLLEGVWTKELLPYPGIAPQRSGNFIRASKNNVIRKLSKASTLTTQSSQSISINSLEDPFTDASIGLPQSVGKCNMPSNINTGSASSRSRAKSAGLVTIMDDLPTAGTAKNVSFTPTRGRGLSDATLVTNECEEEKGRGAGRKTKTPLALLKALSSEGFKKKAK